MPRLPHPDRADVPEAKIVNYLLSARHSGGRAKHASLRASDFAPAIGVYCAMPSSLTQGKTISPHHTKPASGPNTKSMDQCQRLTVAPVVRVVWFVELQETFPRLVTLVPRRIVAHE
jgi:hypothetical protein